MLKMYLIYKARRKLGQGNHFSKTETIQTLKPLLVTKSTLRFYISYCTWNPIKTCTSTRVTDKYGNDFQVITYYRSFVYHLSFFIHGWNNTSVWNGKLTKTKKPVFCNILVQNNTKYKICKSTLILKNKSRKSNFNSRKVYLHEL